jgi:hypothetical protein
MKNSPSSDDEREYPYWNRVYITVIVYTICLIVGLWAFGKMSE